MGDSPKVPDKVDPGAVDPAFPMDPAFQPEMDPLLPAYFLFWSGFGWLILGLQVFCVIHVVRTGRPYWWIWVIFLFPFVGVAAYLLVEVRPSFGKMNWQALWWKLKSSKQRIAHHREQLEYAPTIKNRFLLADELHAADKFDEECEVLSAGLQGAFKDDSETLLRISQAHLEAGRVADAEKMYARIAPDRSNDFQARYKLQQARLWGAKGENIKAETHFQELIKQRRSEAPRYYYALFLLSTRRAPEATKILKDILHQFRRGTRVWRHQEGEWYALAKKTLRGAMRARQPVA